MKREFAIESIEAAVKNYSEFYSTEEVQLIALKNLVTEDELLMLAESCDDDRISAIVRECRDSKQRKVTDKQRHAIAAFLLERHNGSALDVVNAAYELQQSADCDYVAIDIDTGDIYRRDFPAGVESVAYLDKIDELGECGEYIQMSSLDSSMPLPNAVKKFVRSNSGFDSADLHEFCEVLNQ